MSRLDKLKREAMKEANRMVLNEQDTELYVYDKYNHLMVGTMDYENRKKRYKFIPNEEGTKRGYKPGKDIPKDTYTLKPGIKP